MTYNMTYIINQSTNNSIVGFTQAINQELTFGWFGILMLIGFSLVVFIGLVTRTGNSQDSIKATAFITFGLSIIFWTLSLVSTTVLVIAIIITGAAIAFTPKG